MSDEVIGINTQMREFLAAEEQRERIAGARLVAWVLATCAVFLVMVLWLILW